MPKIIEYNASTYSIELRIEGDESADYPKSYGAFNSKTWAHDSEGKISHITQVGVRIQAVLQPNGVTGKANETGLKRLESFVRHAVKLHGPVQFVRLTHFINDIELPAALAGQGEILS